MMTTFFKTWTGRRFLLGPLTRAFRLVFNLDGPSQLVLKDLADFARYYHPNGTFDDNPYRHAMFEGRRQVVQRIFNHLHLEDAQIMSLYMDKQINQLEEP